MPGPPPPPQWARASSVALLQRGSGAGAQPLPCAWHSLRGGPPERTAPPSGDVPRGQGVPHAPGPDRRRRGAVLWGGPLVCGHSIQNVILPSRNNVLVLGGRSAVDHPCPPPPRPKAPTPGALRCEGDPGTSSPTAARCSAAGPWGGGSSSTACPRCGRVAFCCVGGGGVTQSRSLPTSPKAASTLLRQWLSREAVWDGSA